MLVSTAIEIEKKNLGTYGRMEYNKFKAKHPEEDFCDFINEYINKHWYQNANGLL